MVAIVSGENIGTDGNDVFELTSAINSFSLRGNGGDDRLKADISFLDSWGTSSIETIEFFGSRSESYSFNVGNGGSSRTVDVSAVTSTVLVEVRSDGSTILGGTRTFLGAERDHVIVNFDMETGAYSGTYQDRILNNTYTNLEGVNAGDGNDRVLGSSGDDLVALGSGTNYFDGRDGLDKIAVIGERSEFTVTRSGDNMSVARASNPTGDLTETVNVERIEYLNSSFETVGQLAFDLDGNAGQTYRLYKAAFDRTPDETGLSHNVNLMDGGFSILDMASAFIGSAEFQQTYGSNVDNTAFLTLLYQNVLNRGPDDAGLAGWLAQLDGGTSREQVLFGFSESGENKANVASAIDDGIWLV